VSSRGELVPLDDRAVVAEGDRGCDWLGDQAKALWRTDAKYRFDALLERYADTPVVDASLRAPHFSLRSTRMVIAGRAWIWLCGATWEFHKPHYIFSDPGGD
jgi:hypothetical protein